MYWMIIFCEISHFSVANGNSCISIKILVINVRFVIATNVQSIMKTYTSCELALFLTSDL